MWNARNSVHTDHLNIIRDISSEGEVSGPTRGLSSIGKYTYLYDGFLTSDLEDLTLPGLSVSELHVDDLGVSGELNIVEDDEGTLDVEHSAVIDTGSDVIVALSGASVNDIVSHFTRIVCCFSCKLLKSASSTSQGGGSRVSDSVLQSSDAYL